MVIHRNGCLHIDVNDCRVDEAHTAALQVYRQNVAFGCWDGNIGKTLPIIDNGLTANLAWFITEAASFCVGEWLGGV